MVDEIINTARRSSRKARTQSAMRRRWSATGCSSGRCSQRIRGELSASPLPARALPVRLTADDLASALDILFQNVFPHRRGRILGVEASAHDGFIDVTVWDRGNGFSKATRVMPPRSDRPAWGCRSPGVSAASGGRC